MFDRIEAQRLLALFLLGFSLFNFPLLSLWDRPVTLFGWPLLALALLVIWGLLIAATAWLMERGGAASRKD